MFYDLATVIHVTSGLAPFLLCPAQNTRTRVSLADPGSHRVNFTNSFLLVVFDEGTGCYAKVHMFNFSRILVDLETVQFKEVI